MPDSRMVHAATASLLLGTAGWAIKELQHKFTIGLAWYILVSLHSICLLLLFGEYVFVCPGPHKIIVE